MAAPRELPLLCSALLALLAECGGSSMCFVSNSYYEVCEHGCCGTSPYEECCDNWTGLIVGLVVAGLVVVCIVVAIVCYLQHKNNNQVVRMVQSAQSRGDTANITILHMSSNNPYERAPHPPAHMMTTTNACNQPTLLPPDVPYGSQTRNHQPNLASGAPPSLAPRAPQPDTDPAFPPGGHPPAGGSSGGASSGTAAMNGAPGMVLPASSSMNEAPAMMPSSQGPGLMPPSSTGGAAGRVMPPSSSMNGGPAMFSSSALPKISPRKGALPAIPVAAGSSSPEGPPPPVLTAFGDPKSKAGNRQREGTSLGATGSSMAPTRNDMGVEDIEEIY